MMLKRVQMTGNIFLQNLNANPNYIGQRNFGILKFFNWISNIFNSVDQDRVTLVGPEMACAEWILRNGGAVRFKGQAEFINNYNVLMKVEECVSVKSLKLEEIYAEGASLTSSGFQHLKNCKNINKITLVSCPHLGDYSLSRLNFIKTTLQHLEIRSCERITDSGILFLTILKNLNKLILADLPSIANKVKCEYLLRKELPNCDIQCDI